jgi:hypothetical protein
MNKHKKNVEALRRHLGRDAVGLNLLDATARDITELRKRFAALEECERDARVRASRDREYLANARLEITDLNSAVEQEKGRRISAEAIARRHADRIAEMAKEAEVEDELPVEKPGMTDEYAREVVKMFKAVRKRFKKAPPPRGKKASVYIEDVAPNLTNDELMGLGMLVAALAVYNVPVSVESDRTMNKVKGWPNENTRKFVRWVRNWIGSTKTEARVYAETTSDVPEARPGTYRY